TQLPAEGAGHKTPEPGWLVEVSQLVRDGHHEKALRLVDAVGTDWLMRLIWTGTLRLLSAEEIEAAYCDCLVRLARRFAAPDFDTSKPLRPYLSKVAWSAGKQQLRARARQPEQFDEEVLLEQPAPVEATAA